MSYKHDVIIYDLEDDMWLPTGYPGYYVSDSGRIWGPGRHGKAGLITPTPGNKYGHLEVSIHVDGMRLHKYVHRLVAETFIPNPHNYPLVRHLDDDPTNNCVENLEWGTQADNMQDAINAGRFVYFSEEDRESAMQKRRMPIIAINLKTGDKLNFISQQEASRVLGVNQACISDVLHRRSSNAKGWYFIHDGDDIDIDLDTYRYHKIKALIKATDLNTGHIILFRGQTAAAEELGMSVSSVNMVLNGKMRQAKGWFFEYVDEGEVIYND